MPGHKAFGRWNHRYFVLMKYNLSTHLHMLTGLVLYSTYYTCNEQNVATKLKELPFVLLLSVLMILLYYSVNSFLKHLINMHNNIQFTTETEDDGQLHFLNILFMKRNARYLKTLIVWKKDTHTATLLPVHIILWFNYTWSSTLFHHFQLKTHEMATAMFTTQIATHKTDMTDIVITWLRELHP